jgi:hypothetical protein
MRNRLLTMVALVACGTVLSSVSGCMAKSRSLVDAGVLKLEKQNTGKVYIVWSDAYEHKTGFVVSGVLKRHDRVGLPIRTRVNVSILAPNGAIIAERHSADIYVPRRRTGKGQSPKRFAVHFSQTPPRGSLIRVKVG